MATYRVRREETETEKRTTVSYATFKVALGDDPAVMFRRLKRDHKALKWEDADAEYESDLDYDEEFDQPELIDASDDDGAEPIVHGQPSDYGLEQLRLQDVFYRYL